jgi:hypothetical protein
MFQSHSFGSVKPDVCQVRWPKSLVHLIVIATLCPALPPITQKKRAISEKIPRFLSDLLLFEIFVHHYEEPSKEQGE